MIDQYYLTKGPSYHLKNCSLMACLVGIYIASWFLQIGNRFSILGSIRFEFFLAAFLTAASVFKLFTDTDKNPSARKFTTSIFIFYLFLFIFSIFSYDQSHSWNVFIERVVKFSLVGLFISTWTRNTSDMIVILFGFFIAMSKIIQEIGRAHV